MNLGVVFPQTEIGSDPVVIKEYVQAVEALGYTHLVAYDHVLGALPRGEWGQRYSYHDMFHEPLVLFGYLAAITNTLELVTDVMILPQRQTALVAKQAAEVDILSNGRLRLGVGIGWNYVEYEALGKSFVDRGNRIEEQIALLRALWTDELVTFQGEHELIQQAGINPLPIQRPIPIWMGGGAERVLRRIVEIADGWFPMMPVQDVRNALVYMSGYAKTIGRDPETIGVEGSISIANKTPDQWLERTQAWRSIGVSHILVNTMRSGLTSPQSHIDVIEKFKETVGNQ